MRIRIYNFEFYGFEKPKSGELDFDANFSKHENKLGAIFFWTNNKLYTYSRQLYMCSQICTHIYTNETITIIEVINLQPR